MDKHQKTVRALQEIRKKMNLSYHDLHRRWPGTPIKPPHFGNLIRYGHKPSEEFKVSPKRADELALFLKQLRDEEEAVEEARWPDKSEILSLPKIRPFFFTPQFIAEAKAHGVIGLTFSINDLGG